MTDDAWRRGRRGDEDDFGPPLFNDDPTGEVHDLSFGESDTGPLPHWTQPPTGEIPRVLTNAATSDPSDDLDVWSSFSGQSPVWRDDPRPDDTGNLALPDDTGGYRDDTNLDPSAPVRREPGRITIGTDPTDSTSRSGAVPRRRPGEPPSRASRSARTAASNRPSAGPPPSTRRDMPTAVAVGLLMAAAFIVALLWKPIAVLVIIVLVLGFAAVEFFDKVSEKGYRPAAVAGIVACVALPIATYWVGEGALPLVLVFAFAAGCATFVGGDSLEAGPMPNMAITMLGVVWIGVMGSFASLILRYATVPGAGDRFHSIGTDTLCVLAIGVAANDIGALAIGSAMGRTPLRRWISPNKTVEGLIGGTLFTVLLMVFIGVSGKSDTWNSGGDALLLGIVIAIAAPLGDLTESMFKRNLDVKDFGTVVKGHGGVLDRFDGFLFTLPAVYYLLEVLRPYVS